MIFVIYRSLPKFAILRPSPGPRRARPILARVIGSCGMAATNATGGGSPQVVTEILQVDSSKLLRGKTSSKEDLLSENWNFEVVEGSDEDLHLQRAAMELRETNIPVAFPTETVYGLGADVTRSSAVLGIFKAKQRPSDNPLIVHISTLQQLREILNPSLRRRTPNRTNGQLDGTSESSYTNGEGSEDPIPSIYRPLIQSFWPGPLSLIMPNPIEGSILAPEVTAGLKTFGVRMPRSPVALALITKTGVPLAAPSANSSTKPSTTTAAHVKRDLQDRISTIIDGGPCEVGVESTVVDGLSNPPLVLRPGGISIDQLRNCPGWENVQVGYKDASEKDSKPKAPGMKYKHYSPTASVILYENSKAQPSLEDLLSLGSSVGIIRTTNWSKLSGSSLNLDSAEESYQTKEKSIPLEGITQIQPRNHNQAQTTVTELPKARRYHVRFNSDSFTLWDIELGSSPDVIARGLFSALRELDDENVNAIVVEGISDKDGDVAAAVMNRLRKAAETKIASNVPGTT